MNLGKKNILILQHMPYEDAGNKLTWASANEYCTTTVLVPVHAGEFPALHSFDVLLILGGMMSAYEEESYPWMKSERAFIARAINADKIIIGICLGPQLLAAALGNNVYPHSQKEIGFFEVYKTANGQREPALVNVPEVWMVFHWHGDTFDIPDGAQHLLYSQACTNQAFRKGNCWAFQFHPEIN